MSMSVERCHAGIRLPAKESGGFGCCTCRATVVGQLFCENTINRICPANLA